jgi:hypothetical protein
MLFSAPQISAKRMVTVWKKRKSAGKFKVVQGGAISEVLPENANPRQIEFVNTGMLEILHASFRRPDNRTTSMDRAL